VNAGRAPEHSSRLVQVNDEVLLHLMDHGGHGPAVLFLHGYASNARIWDDVIARVRPFSRSVALDLRGHGLSSNSPGLGYGKRHQIADVHRVVEGLAATDVVLVGHSWGGAVAAAVAATSVRRIAGLVLVDSAPSFTAAVSQHMRDMLRRLAARFSTLHDCVSLFLELYPGADPDRVRRFAEASAQRGPDGGVRLRVAAPLLTDVDRVFADEASCAELDGWATLRRVRCPTLVVRGAWSAILSAGEAQRMAREVLASADLVAIPRAGHAVPLDSPESLGASLREFLVAIATEDKP
jgi:pimeloyl-ACP methyl ester carboxylesterase